MINTSLTQNLESFRRTLHTTTEGELPGNYEM